MTTTEIEYDVRECGCRYEVIEPGKRWRINGLDRCGPHQREAIIRSDAMGSVESLIERDCLYRYDDPADQLRWLDEAADQLQAAADEIRDDIREGNA